MAVRFLYFALCLVIWEWNCTQIVFGDLACAWSSMFHLSYAEWFGYRLLYFLFLQRNYYYYYHKMKCNRELQKEVSFWVCYQTTVLIGSMQHCWLKLCLPIIETLGSQRACGVLQWLWLLKLNLLALLVSWCYCKVKLIQI